MDKRPLTTEVDRQVTTLLAVMVDAEVPVECVLAGAWAAVSRAMIDHWGATLTAEQHEHMASTIRNLTDGAAAGLATARPAGRA